MPDYQLDVATCIPEVTVNVISGSRHDLNLLSPHTEVERAVTLTPQGSEALSACAAECRAPAVCQARCEAAPAPMLSAAHPLSLQLHGTKCNYVWFPHGGLPGSRHLPSKRGSTGKGAECSNSLQGLIWEREGLATCSDAAPLWTHLGS